MAKEFSVIIERDAEGYYVATVPGIRGCYTQAKSLDERMARVKEAVELCLEDPDDQADALDFVGVQKITVNPYGSGEILAPPIRSCFKTTIRPASGCNGRGSALGILAIS